MTSYYNQDCEKYVSSAYRRSTTETDCDEDEEQAECKMMCSIDACKIVCPCKKPCHCEELENEVCGSRGLTYENDCVLKCFQDTRECSGACPCE